MIPEAGQIALIIALCLGALQGTVPLIGAWRGERWAMNIAPSLAAGVGCSLALILPVRLSFLMDVEPGRRPAPGRYPPLHPFVPTMPCAQLLASRLGACPLVTRSRVRKLADLYKGRF